jgi:hypothetical protein
MSVIENIDVVMGAQTAQLDAAVAKEIKQLQKLETVASGFSNSASALGSFAAGFFTLTAAAAGAAFAVSKVSEAWKQLDESADVGARLGMSFADLNTTRESIGRSTGMDAGSIDATMQKMNLNLANAAASSNAELANRLAMLGLEAGQLIKAGPLQAIKEISAATKDLSPSDQMIIAYETFGKQGVAMVQALRDGPEAIAEMEAKLTASGSNISDAQIAQIGAAQDAWDDAVMLVTGLFRTVAAESAPLVELFSEWAQGTGESFSGWGESLEFVVDTAAYFSGVMYDAYEVVNLQYTLLSKMATMDFSGAGESLRSAMDLSTGDRNVMALAEKRQAAEEKAAKDAADRRSNAGIESEIEAYERAQAEKKRLEEEAAREEQEKQKQADKERQELLKEAESIQKRIDSMGNQPGKFGAASAQEGSVEAYKLLLQRDNEQKEIAEEAKQQTILQQRMADLLEQANMKPTVQLARAR